MSGLKELAKGGWHPKGRDGGKESWRGDSKGVNTVAGWVGKGKNPNQAQREHQSTPLSSLKDPASFGPPPKHVKYHGPAAASPSSPAAPADPMGLQRPQQAQQPRAHEAEAAKPPPGPYKADTTGLSTVHPPKPPSFRPGAAPALSTASQPPKPKPKLPPRLPPRQNSHPDNHGPDPPPPYTETSEDNSTAQEYLNQSALSRLGQAGVSVPGLNIGRNASPPIPPRQGPALPSSTSPTASSSQGPQLSELQSRFARMSAPSSDAPATGTSWAEKQAALRTADNLRHDPSKVSLSDMKAAASTANNFRERHGEQAAAGWRTANTLNQKYRIAERLNDTAGQSSASVAPQSPLPSAVGKKSAPPPPPKRKDIGVNPSSPTEPPPIPLGSKPKSGL